MKNTLILLLCSAVIITSCSVDSDSNSSQDQSELKPKPEYAIVLHGGAGYRGENDPRGDSIYKAHLQVVLDQGTELLKKGNSAVGVVQACLMMLEDDSLFNAGKGAVLNAEGRVELDASIMRGSDLQAGAVSSVTTTRHPIAAARFVMDSSAHVFLSGSGADRFAQGLGLEQVDPEFFVTRDRRANWNEKHKAQSAINKDPNSKFGTVGCVVLDQSGHLAAGTSTGGMSGKKWGRIGDSPVIGAGTYADDRSCAVSCTGHGEYYIRNAVAYQIAARMEFGGQSVERAADEVVNGVLSEKAGAGGVIALDKNGNIAMPFNTPSMFRAWRVEGRSEGVKIW